jgi:hypothetical protein
MWQRWSGITLVLTLFGLVGCGAGIKDQPQLAPAGGVLKLKGAPLADASVTFYPTKGTPGFGRTDANGVFQIKTNGQLGAIVGKHKVTAGMAQQSGPPAPADGNEMALIKKSELPNKYSDQNTTDLNIDIPAEGNTKLVLDLTD